MIKSYILPILGGAMAPKKDYPLKLSLIAFVLFVGTVMSLQIEFMALSSWAIGT